MYYEYLKLSSRTRVLEQKFFSARVAQFHKLYASLSDQITEKDERIDTLKKQTTELQHKLEELEEQNAEWSTNNNKLQAELDIVNKDVKRLQAISVEKERKIERLNVEVESCRKEKNAASNAQIDRLERELEKLRKENAKLADRNKELIDKNKKLGNDKVLGKKNMVLEKKYVEIANKYDEIKKKYDGLVKTNQKQLGEFKYRNTLLEEKNLLEENYREQITGLSEKLKEHEDLIKSFKIDRIKYEEKIDELTKDNTKLSKKIKNEITGRSKDNEKFKRSLDEERCKYNDMLKKKMLKDQNVVDREEVEKKEMELKKLKSEYEHMKGSLNQKEDIIQLQNKVIKQLENNNQKMKMVYGDEQYDNDLESSLVLLDRKINDNKKELPETKDKTPIYVDIGDVFQRNNDKNVQKSVKNPKTGGTNEKSTKKRKTNVKSIKNIVNDKKVPFPPPKVRAQIKQGTPKQPPEDKNVSFFQNLTFSDSSPVIKKPFFKKP